jgi:hypothetical protein
MIWPAERFYGVFKMPLPESSLSIICSSIRQFVDSSLNAAANNISVSIGAPAEVADNDDDHRLNLFFYRFEPGGFDSDAHPNDPRRVRLLCLITAFGILEDGIPAGENELRLLGEVLRIFRETPVLGAVTVNGEQVRLQVVFSPATDEQINQVWSTQGDTTYRPSVIYDMALAPIMPSTLRVEPALVGAIGRQALTGRSGRFAAFSGTALAPQVPFHAVDIDDPRWAPAICWLYLGECAHTLSFDVDSAEFAVYTPQVWLAGDPAQGVDLVWEIWDSTGWRSIGAPLAATPFSTAIDPANVPMAVSGTFPLDLTLPVSIAAGENAVQAMLHATRSVTLVPGQPAVEVRSNPLLISLYRIS